MDMLLRNTTILDLAHIFERNAPLSPAPYLENPEAVKRARTYCEKHGIWQEIYEALDPAKDIPVIKRSAYRNFRRLGDRSLPQAKASARLRELELAALALWLDHPKADIDYLQDLLWAYCDEHTWVMAAHEGRAIDLGSAMLAATLAEILYVLGDVLEDEVKQRVSLEIDERIFQNFWNYARSDSWKTARHNWNHVCNGEIIRAALYQIRDPYVLANMVHSAIQNMTYALDGFTDDGGCVEGPGYWDYGFGHFAHVAHALYLKTAGELNLMSDPKVERICEYPLAANIASPVRSTFADSSNGYVPARVAMIINEFYRMETLYGLCKHHEDGSLELAGIHEMAMYHGHKETEPDQKDYLLPDLGQVKLRGAPGFNQMTLMALAGNNGVNHNHNDIGSFIVYKYEQVYLVDPGSPIYTQKTFSDERYSSVFCNSVGHSVPTINSRLQEEGADHFGTLTVENLNGTGQKQAVIDMTDAYPEGTVQCLSRTFVLDSDANRLLLEDAFTLRTMPTSLEEAFITFHPVQIELGGQSVRIGDEHHFIVIQSHGTPGKFSVRALEEESKEGQAGKTINRITFEPVALSKDMHLRFMIE